MATRIRALDFLPDTAAGVDHLLVHQRANEQRHHDSNNEVDLQPQAQGSAPRSGARGIMKIMRADSWIHRETGTDATDRLGGQLAPNRNRTVIDLEPSAAPLDPLEFERQLRPPATPIIFITLSMYS